MTDLAELDRLEEYAERLRDFGRAYPTTVFHVPTDEERAWLHAERPGLHDCLSAEMGRHMAKFTTQAADKIDELRAQVQADAEELARLREAVSAMQKNADCNHSHKCRACGLNYTPTGCEDCPACGSDGSDTPPEAAHD